MPALIPKPVTANRRHQPPLLAKNRAWRSSALYRIGRADRSFFAERLVRCAKEPMTAPANHSPGVGDRHD